MQCPCGSGKSYADCCQMAHTDIKNVTTAEQLMRSRYSAFVLAKVDYLNLSQTSKMTKVEKRELKHWTKSVQWQKLVVKSTDKGTALDTTGKVEFEAFFVENGQPNSIAENSDFRKEEGIWNYVST